MTVNIPQEYSVQFSGFFKEFDQKLEELGVVSYGLSISTLEEVFLKIGHQDNPSPTNTKALMPLESEKDENDENKTPNDADTQRAVDK